MQLGVAERNPQTGEDCESIKNPEGYVGPLFSTSDLHSVPAGLCNWYWRTQVMFSVNFGLVTSRNDRSTPRDSVLPSSASRFPQPAVAAYRCGSSASAPEEADAVNSLQPLVSADLEQPQNRQGTSVFLLLPRQMSTIFSQLYLLCFQSSAARPQRHAEFLCNPENQAWQWAIWDANFADFAKWKAPLAVTVTARGTVKIWQEPCPVRDTLKLDFHLSDCADQPPGVTPLSPPF